MLASLLPGLRDVRTPLAVGYLWLVLVWIWWSEDISGAFRDSEVGDRVRELHDTVGAAGSLAAISFAAYVLGAVAVLPADRGLLRTTLGMARGMVPNLEAWEVQDNYLVAVEGLKAEILDQAREDGVTPEQLTSLGESLDRAAETLPVQLRPQLLVSNQEMFGEYDRLEAESLFRINLCLPVLAAAITLGVDVSGWFFVLGPLVTVAFLFQGLSRQAAAEAVILEAVLAGVIEHPLSRLQPRPTQ